MKNEVIIPAKFDLTEQHITEVSALHLKFCKEIGGRATDFQLKDKQVSGSYSDGVTTITSARLKVNKGTKFEEVKKEQPKPVKPKAAEKPKAKGINALGESLKKKK